MTTYLIFLLFLGGSQRIIPDIMDFFGFWSWRKGDISLYDTTAGNDSTDGEEQIYKSGMGDERKRKRRRSAARFCEYPSFLLDGFDDLVLVVYI